uniref:Uncharacterized protein n=1 Tax=Arundo donax TaxID=35708 RepID=A0A0A9GLI6_ARUDO
MNNPSHTQTSSSPARPPAAADVPKPALPARGATPPAAREPSGGERERQAGN